ncbi:MAG: hypothetical protein EOP85_15880 [Verrucomicrobiaceae bacterium]|nr:MAG: hypothetical protein EOP85_15880 [Verrucomicrobiaceae bacterium]
MAVTIMSWQAAEMISGKWAMWPEAERLVAVKRVLAKVDPASRGDYISRIAGDWAKTDPAATVRWLEALPQEDADSAAGARVSSLAPHDLTVVLDWAERLPPGKRRDSLVGAFDAWTAANPGQRADRSGWPDDRVRAWEDLEALLLGRDD